MMRKSVLFLLVFFLLLPFAISQERIQLKFDPSEADAVLAILAKQASGAAVADSDWHKLFISEPYIRLKKREASMHRDFTDDDFKRFVLSGDLAKKAAALRQTLESWKQADLKAVAARILPYLPADAKIKTSVYPMIKPRPNSFVFETTTDPAIFLYLDPEQSRSAFENTVAHESHHIGFSDANRRYDEKIQSLPENPRKAAEWMGAFGEGLAVLAASGSIDVHPMRDFPQEDRIRWDQDMRFVDQEQAQLNQFFLDVIQGGYAKPEIADHVAFTFMGYRGPWYVVGYRLGKVVEQHFGREVLVQCMADPRLLLVKYNQAAEEENKRRVDKLPLWSDEILQAVGAPKTQ